jgi:2,3-bisphosphoglycerate-dependent phosphoglycerate mutase
MKEGRFSLKTYIFFVRHAESPYIPGEERLRGLSDKGISDALLIHSALKHEEIEVFISSPYERAIQTIKATAGNNEILIFEDLRERQIGNIPDDKFKESKQKVYQDFNFSFPEGESSKQAQERAIKVLLEVLNTYEGKKIVIGTHGDILTLMMNFFDKSFDYEFWRSTTMPDIYKLEMEGNKLIKVTREWK